MTLRRTKIVATLGPATSDTETLGAIIDAGVNVLRLNFSHGSAEDHIQNAQKVREIAESRGKFIAILADLQGPKLRISRFKEQKIQLEQGATFILDTQLGVNDGTQERVGVDYKALIDDVVVDDILLLDDGRVELQVNSLTDHEIICTVIIAGPLSNNKGVNRKGGGLSAKALTEKDQEDIITAAELGADYIAVSFPRDAQDMHEARKLVRAAGSSAGLVAKIERAEIVADNQILDDIIRASEVVMVARGDLAVEIGDAELVAVQKHIIARSRSLNRVVITATQMMESMIDSPMPTRAEVSDVANAVFDNTDAVMLSAESAVGKYPVETIAAMARICAGAEKHASTHTSKHRLDEHFKKIDETIALSAMYAANHLDDVKAIICLTESGSTPLLMSRIRSALPIFAFSPHEKTQRKVSIYRGVHTVPFDLSAHPKEKINQHAVNELINRGVVQEGDIVILTKGDFETQGGTNAMKIIKIGTDVI